MTAQQKLNAMRRLRKFKEIKEKYPQLNDIFIYLYIKSRNL